MKIKENIKNLINNAPANLAVVIIVFCFALFANNFIIAAVTVAIVIFVSFFKDFNLPRISIYTLIIAIISPIIFSVLITKQSVAMVVIVVSAFFIFNIKELKTSLLSNLLITGITFAITYSFTIRFLEFLSKKDLFLPVYALAIFGGCVYCFAVFYLLKLVFIKYSDNSATVSLLPNESKGYILVAVISAILIIGVCSKSSPLYPFNDWVDINCYFTMGRSMLKGMVPYKDLFDHKGPLLYILYVIAAFISDTTFLGVYFLEVIAATAFLCICYKTVYLYSEKVSCIWMPVIAAIVYSGLAFSHGGSTEEMCLPFIAYGIYCGIKAIKNKTLPTNFESFIIGITSACVLYIKFSMLGFYLGWFGALFLFSLYLKQFKYIFKVIGFIILGIITVTAPIIVYFIINGALKDFWMVYFYNNIFLYCLNAEVKANKKTKI